MEELIQGRYTIERSLGRGGQGETFQALDAHTGRHVALKSLHMKHVEDWKAVELFEREGQVLQSIDHPGVPDYVDAFSVQDGPHMRLYLVQEFVEGDNLDARLHTRGRFEEAEVEAVMISLLETLDTLHRRVPPIIHRDIKPSNIIESPDGRFYLIDFGAVQHTLARTLGDSTMVGTPGYMPMEQVVGRAVPATDLYSLAVTLCVLWTGVDPSDVQMKQGKLDYLAHLPRESRLAQLLDHLLAPSVEDRPASAREVLAAWRSPKPLVDVWSPVGGPASGNWEDPGVEVMPDSTSAVKAWLRQIEAMPSLQSGPLNDESLRLHRGEITSLGDVWEGAPPHFSHEQWEEGDAVFMHNPVGKNQLWWNVKHEARAIYRHEDGHSWLVAHANGFTQVVSFLDDGRAITTLRESALSVDVDFESDEESRKVLLHDTIKSQHIRHVMPEHTSLDELVQAHARHIEGAGFRPVIMRDLPLEWMMLCYASMFQGFLYEASSSESLRAQRKGFLIGVMPAMILMLCIPLLGFLWYHRRQWNARQKMVDRMSSWRPMPDALALAQQQMQEASEGSLVADSRVALDFETTESSAEATHQVGSASSS